MRSDMFEVIIERPRWQGRSRSTGRRGERRRQQEAPQIYCFACPCPVSECRGNKCITETLDASTCGGAN